LNFREDESGSQKSFMKSDPLQLEWNLSTSREAAARLKPKAKLCEPWEPHTKRMSREAATEILPARIFCLTQSLCTH
jgi:hypothetical protein